MTDEKAYPSYWNAVVRCRCPRCREGALFANPINWRTKKNLHMHPHCMVCRQPTDIEVGFYYGTGYVSYLMSLFLTGVSFLLWFLVVGMSYNDQRFVVWIISNSVGLLVLQPWLMRFSRSLWLSWFVRYDADWLYNEPDRLERTNEQQGNNW